MDERSRKLLLDVQAAAEAIVGFTVGVDRQRYAGDLLLRSAVERQFEVVGEALNRLRRHDLEMIGRIDDRAKIIGFRNVLAHGYDAIDDGIPGTSSNARCPICCSKSAACWQTTPCPRRSYHHLTP